MILIKPKLYKQQYQPRTLVEHQGLSFTYIGKHNRISHTKVRGQTQNIIMKVDRDKLLNSSFYPLAHKDSSMCTST